ncbi:MAG: mechanosensitive ion channel [Pirellulales bacterium]
MFGPLRWMSFGRLGLALFIWGQICLTASAQLQINPPAGESPAAQSGTTPTTPPQTAQTNPPVGATNPTVSANGQVAVPPAQPTIQPPVQPNVQPAPPTTVTPATPSIVLTPEAISARMEQVQRSLELEAAMRESLTTLYQRALADLKAAAESQRLRKDLAVRLEAAPKALAEAKKKKEQLPARSEPINSLDLLQVDELSFDELQKDLQTRQAKLTAATELRTKLAEQVDTREKRRKELPQLISEARTKLEQLTREQAPAAAVAAPIADPALKEATTWAQLAQKQAVTEQMQLLEQEQRVYEAETELLPLQLELARADEKALQEQTRRLSEEIERMRQDQILQQRQDVRALIEKSPDELRPFGDRLLRRVQDWLDLARKKAGIKAELESSRALLEKWKDRYSKMVNRVEPQAGQDVTAGFNSWVGLMLRKQRSELPDPQKLERAIREYQQEDQDTDKQLFEMEDDLQQINSWRDGGSSGDELVTQAPGANPLLEPRAVVDEHKPALERLLTKEKELIEKMRIDIDTYQNDLYQVADLKEQTRLLVKNYHSFIEKHVLWIRSSDQLEKSELKQAVEAFHWLVSYENWKFLGLSLQADIQSRFWWWILFTVGLAVILFNHSRMRRSLTLVGDRAAKSNAVSFVLTTESFLLTVVISLPVPLTLLFFHWRLADIDDGAQGFCKAVAHGLLVAAAVFSPLEFLRQLCRPSGLGEKHFDWSGGATKLLSRNLRWMIDLATPMSALVGIMEGQLNTRWESSLGRLAFLVLMCLLLIFFARIFVPSKGIFGQYLKKHPGGWLDRLRYGWYTLIVISPIILAALSFIGFHYTAQRLSQHMHTSFWTLIGLTTVYCLLRRWLLLSRRKIMIAQAKQRLADAAKRDPSQAVSVTSEEKELNLTAINEQTMRLVSSFMIVAGLVAVSLIWSDVLPAIGMLENFKLWDVQGSKPDEIVTITLANLVFVLPIAVLTTIAARNLPGLMEIALLQHLPLTGAARYAISTLSRYAILFLGIIGVSSAIGLRWQSVQWLVAALGVGLGFGLQEIFANFVSGLILLFEQPIRVGDVITIDGVTGSVSKIRMRATTITNWDRQELIVPNKDLITGKLLNWTLSDTTNRIQIKVSVVYGSDTERACKILREICEQHPNIMKDPPLTVVFDGIQEGSLVLVIRAFLANLDVRLDTLHQIYTQIHRRFADEGIEIALPQRELIMRSAPRQMFEVLGGGGSRRSDASIEPTGSGHARETDAVTD